ncbi:hypothetical protein DRF62_20010 [Chryseobacterium piscium]|uniref:RepA protein n=1 Tax=Chryseobacterium piscium TaxID=333702 RepID=A0A3D9B349_9FLAO|nr:hypothetical protein [Chryseobacterium piscium]REC47656.1 hypothetical protein DRF62_20010 [Chryseobacterium piscium]
MKNDRTEVKLNDIKKHETNPFMVELKGKMFLQPRANMIIAKGENIVNMETGEVIKDNTLIGRRKVVDKSQFAKIYASEIGILYELSKSAQNVFLYLTKVMDYDNKAYFNYLSDFQKLGYKGYNTPYLGLKELIQRDIIASAVMPHFYWMNPAIVCKGERFSKYTEYLTEEEAKREQEFLLKQQGRKFIENMPQSVSDKFSYASNKIDRTSENENIHPDQTTLNFDDENPYP